MDWTIVPDCAFADPVREGQRADAALPERLDERRELGSVGLQLHVDGFERSTPIVLVLLLAFALPVECVAQVNLSVDEPVAAVEDDCPGDDVAGNVGGEGRPVHFL